MTTEIKTDEHGTTRYYKDGLIHRADGPAIIWSNGNLWWYQNGKRHREDGPAVMWFNGEVRWYFDDKLYTFKDWCAVANISDQQKTLLMIKYNTHDN